jgi:hypothetical protein
MNSLYGKFGQNPNFDQHAIINEDEFFNYQNKYIILD